MQLQSITSVKLLFIGNDLDQIEKHIADIKSNVSINTSLVNIDTKHPDLYFEVCNNGEEALGKISYNINKNEFYSIAFIEFENNNAFSAINIAKKIKSMDSKIFIVFISDKTSYTLPEIEKEVPHFFYLQNPVQPIVISQMTIELVQQWIDKVYTSQLNTNLIQDIISKDLSIIKKDKEIEEQQKLSIENKLTDEVTKLPNLYGSNRIFNKIISNNDNSTLTVFIIRIHEFSRFREIYGIDAANLIVNQICNRISDLKIDNITRGRISENDISLIAENMSEKDNKKLVDKLLNLSLLPIVVLRKRIITTLGIGIACYPQDGASFFDLSRNATIAANIALTEGKNRAQSYNRIMDKDIRDNLQMQTELLSAIRNNEFYLVYQPVVDKNKSLFGAEVLLRWNNKTLGQVPPDRFIPVAESCNLIIQIGEWVLVNACRQAGEWYKKYQKRLKLMINISSIQLESEGFLTLMEDTLMRYNLSHEHVELEITERIIIDDNFDINNNINTLKAKGVHFSIDDFGTGYSALSYLLHFPFDLIKIDKSFVKDMVKEKRGHELIKAITALGHSLGIEIISEGIETEEQFNHLVNLSCHYFQGYYFSRPVIAGDFEAEWLEKIK